VSGGGAQFDIDGYRGTTILEAKHVGNLKSSPYLPKSKIPKDVRTEILRKFHRELRCLRQIIRSGESPFKSVEIITNTPESKALFEGLLKEVGVPGTVRLAI
jgi:hypothetical protein